MHMQETVRALNGLIRICRTSEERCRALAGFARTPEVAHMLRGASEEWSRHGDELQALVLHLDGKPRTRAAAGGWLMRLRMLASRALFVNMDMPTLAAWEVVQGEAVRGYIDALRSYWPERIRRTVRLQADRAEDRYGRIAGLRGRYALHAPGGRL
jgi:uncharacterized protein (TIGR02284 family)